MVAVTELTRMEAHELSIELEAELVRNERCQKAINVFWDSTKNDPNIDQDLSIGLMMDYVSLEQRNRSIIEQLEALDYPVEDDFSEDEWRAILKDEHEKAKEFRAIMDEAQEDDSFEDSYYAFYRARFRIDRIKERMTGRPLPLW